MSRGEFSCRAPARKLRTDLHQCGLRCFPGTITLLHWSLTSARHSSLGLLESSPSRLFLRADMCFKFRRSLQISIFLKCEWGRRAFMRMALLRLEQNRWIQLRSYSVAAEGRFA